MGKKQIDIQQKLVDDCLKGDPKAPMELYRLYYKAVFSTSYRILSNKEEAEDIMQETFITAFDKLEQFRGGQSFGAWLKRIAVNKSLDLLRQKTSFIDFDTELPEEQDASADATYSEYVNYQINEIKTAVPKLPVRYRTVLSLYLFEGYDHEEIAQILDIKHNAARTRYSRAKACLLRILSEQSVMKMFVPN